jgi:hypothetical protein
MPMWIRAIAAALALALFVASPALAQGRGAGRPEIFAVSGVVADVTGESAAAARPAAFTQAQRIAFQRLVRRIVPGEQVAAAQALNPTDGQLAALQAGIDIEDERSSRTRYIGRFTVNFDPVAVRAYLRAAGLTTVETRGATTLVVALFEGAPAPQQDLWRQAWEQGGFARELAPIAVAPASIQGPASWAGAEPAAAAGAAAAVFATVRLSPGTLTAELVEVSPSAPPRDWGQTSVRLQGGETSLDQPLRELAQRANALIQDAWKQTLVAGTADPVRLQATALFTSQREWAQIKRALGAAASTLVSGVRIEALTRRGAMVSFTYVGAPEQLAAVLRQQGVDIQIEGSAALLRPVGGSG